MFFLSWCLEGGDFVDTGLIPIVVVAVFVDEAARRPPAAPARARKGIMAARPDYVQEDGRTVQKGGGKPVVSSCWEKFGSGALGDDDVLYPPPICTLVISEKKVDLKATPLRRPAALADACEIEVSELENNIIESQIIILSFSQPCLKESLPSFGVVAFSYVYIHPIRKMI